MSGSLRGRRSEEITQLNTSSPQDWKYLLESQKRFLEEGRMEGEKESVLPSVGEEQIGGRTR